MKNKNLILILFTMLFTGYCYSEHFGHLLNNCYIPEKFDYLMIINLIVILQKLKINIKLKSKI